jgi:hypothetical protein
MKKLVVAYFKHYRSICLEELDTRFRLVMGFIEILKSVTTSNSNIIANLHALQFTVVHTKFSQFILTNHCLATVPNNADSSASVFNGSCPRWLATPNC